MKLVIGSVQLGRKYGLVDGKRVTTSEVFKIQNLIYKSKISFIDTSANYGNSEKKIGNSELRNLNIITKFKLPKKIVNIKKWTDLKIKTSLSNLKTNRIYGLLIHDVRDIFGKKGKEYLKCLYYLKKIGIVKYIGLSVYSPKDLEKVWMFWRPDIVQLPFNIFDQRFLHSNWLLKLKKNKVKIFVRSCFLQGLLVSDYLLLAKFKKYHKYLNFFRDWCRVNKISRKKACIHFIKKHSNLINFLIIGFNNHVQLKEIIKIYKQKTVSIPYVFRNENLSLIDPRRW